MSETPRELLVWEEFVASDGYVFGSGVRSATDDEIRAAVVPLLNLEAAARYFCEVIHPEYENKPCDGHLEWVNDLVGLALAAAEGGEE